MTSIKKSVKITGTLQGGGYKRLCRLKAIKVTNPSMPGAPAYAKPELLDPDDDFPDGSYEIVVAGGQTFPLIKRDGVYHWKV
jgi:hypothetical protein